MNKIIFFLLILYLKEGLSDSCEKHNTCSACIRDESVCVWCASKTYNSEQRCMPKTFTESNSTWCPDSLQNPENFANSTEDNPFSSGSKNVTQIKPQRYIMKLRPGLPQNFSFSFKFAEDYPVDLYFLFDTSATMSDRRNATSRQSENIYSTMLNMTKNVVMGMGSYVDKNMLPNAYENKISSKLAYSFIHRLSLTKDFQEFQKAVINTPLGENRDSPEGGFDALAQAIVCKDVIGWRNQSRKIVVLMTDASPHAAGDGRSAGLFKPYNGSCFTVNNVYTKETEIDYPSVSMISKLARDNSVIVIFAVAKNQPVNSQPMYHKLTSYITGSRIISLAAKNDPDFKDDIVTKLKEIYEEVSTRIKLNVQPHTNGLARRRDFEIKFDPDCTKNLTACDVTRNDVKYFNATITLLNYENYDRASIDIALEGISEKVTLDIDVINDCECERDVEHNSQYCSNQTRVCGICQCETPWYGVTCQCNPKTMAVDNSTSTCMTGNMTHDCNQNGECNCGKCSCKSGFVGPYCECSTQNCPQDKGIVCGHGDCQCDGTCKCQRDYSGDACQCFQTEQYCLAPNNKVCNNRGKCSCGKCKCDDLASWDSRNDFTKHCVIKPCPECHSLQCKTLTDCALCLLENKDCNKCNYIHSQIVDKLPENINNSINDGYWHICKRIGLDMGCYTNFAYKHIDDPYGIEMMLEKDKNCADSYYIYGGIVLLCVLLVGIFTVLGWKLITYLRDRQEYLQFMKNHVPDTAPCDNPLYEPASTTFRNPAFGKQCIR